MAHLSNLPELYGLNLEFNQISSMGAFSDLANLKLKHILLAGNSVSDDKMYDGLFDILPFLKTVDRLNRDGDVLSSSSEESEQESYTPKEIIIK